MEELVELWRDSTEGIQMIAGWHQWADAGDVSSGLPQYLIDQTRATKIGELKSDDFYLFQLPGTHHLLRPVIRLSEGHPKELQERRNEFYYSGVGDNGLLVFVGEEPHLDEARYAESFLDAVEELGVTRVATIAGVHGPVPYDRDREISCVYSLPQMREELANYGVKFSNYEGGTTISMYLAHLAGQRGIELLRFCAHVPSYDFSEGAAIVHPLAMENDFKAWLDLMRRLDHMFSLEMDLSDLERQSGQLASAWESKIAEWERIPSLRVRAYMEEVNAKYTERPFLPLSDAWEDALGDLFEDRSS